MITPQVTRCIPGTALVEMLDAYQRSERGLPTYPELRALCDSPAGLGATSAIIIAAKDGEIATLTAECERLAEVRNAAVAGSSTDWRIYHSALSQCAALLDNMAENDALVDVPKYLALKLAAAPVAGSVGDDNEFLALLTLVETSPRYSKELSEASRKLIAYLDSRAPAAPAKPEPAVEGMFDDIEFSRKMYNYRIAKTGAQSASAFEAVKAHIAPVARPLAPSWAVPKTWEGRTPWRPGGYCDSADASKAMQAEIAEWRALAAQPLAGQAVGTVTEWEAAREDCDGNALIVMRQDELALAADFIRHDSLQCARIDGKDISRQQMMSRLITASSHPRVQPLAGQDVGTATDGIIYKGEDGTVSAYLNEEMIWHANIYCNSDDFNEEHVAEQVSRLLAAAQPLAASAVPDTAFLQFLTDVVTAAGLLSHGKTDKALAKRIAEEAYQFRAAAPRQEAQPAVLKSEGVLFIYEEQNGAELEELFEGIAYSTPVLLAAPSQQPAASPTGEAK